MMKRTIMLLTLGALVLLISGIGAVSAQTEENSDLWYGPMYNWMAEHMSGYGYDHMGDYGYGHMGNYGYGPDACSEYYNEGNYNPGSYQTGNYRGGMGPGMMYGY
ncbi:MAG: hypothetical protein SCH66_12005 [Methanolobus sp.]|nr:hypothetical protein [Methanolobus sp.]